MGKEAKIGLAVIAILLITFGVVLAKRLSGSNDGSAEAAAAEKDPKTGGSKNGPAGRQPETKPRDLASVPTMVPAASNKPPQGSPGASALMLVSDGQPGQSPVVPMSPYGRRRRA